MAIYFKPKNIPIYASARHAVIISTALGSICNTIKYHLCRALYPPTSTVIGSLLPRVTRQDNYTEQLGAHNTFLSNNRVRGQENLHVQYLSPYVLIPIQ